LFAAALVSLALARAQAAPAAQSGQFDYYLLALSWSPTYCASGGAARREPLQCGQPRGFIVHGLWPEYENGWPSHCASSQPRDVALDVQRRQLDLTPSAGLIVHEWQTHGLCTGLAQNAYFDEIRALRAKVRLPLAFTGAPSAPQTTTAAALRAAFVKANSGLPPQGLAVVCDKGRLEEVRLCFSKAGAFRACPADIRDTCQGAVRAPASGTR